ncbi:hypothetical protein PENARI_c012G10216 [Penicillium arizonense]|uniref:Zn(2)-C6 fungal-type domain-containing protein n=1 Tax=Penicillium arizonense TaxID=1835702 RepID=A0A1F5LEP0_PENAI|nr:hypothetical protein PENARI_c012G10216 [Penicillium arizonense]OGE51694.1 hypothetical protein PENARI_c012G10216 [Penicillium arizonense]
MSEASTPLGESSTLQPGSAQQLNRSCESCRSLKVRCLPSPSTPNQCQRCAKGKRTCVFVPPQRRRPRKRTDSRVAQLEKEMRMMRSLLKGRIREESEPESEGSEVDDRDLEGDGELKTMRDHSAHSSDRYMDYSPELMNTHPGGHDRVPFSGPPSFAGLPPGFEMEETPPVEDVIDRGILSLEDAEQLVAYFIHELAYFFPLVVLPLNTTAAQLRQTKPVLFLSVIAATSISVDAGLAAVLNREMVRLYSERFFIEGEKSLELVQALLLMIIFYFPPASPLKLQFYQYTHIASTMALEIGLANKRRVSKKSDRKNRLEPHDELLAEQARAVLGCYHLGSTVAMKTRRQNLLQFNDWVTECVKHLEHSPHRTDQHLAVWFELQRITDEAMSSFGLDDTSATSPLTESRVQAVLRWFDKRMDTWKKNTPSAMLTVPMILEYRSTALAMYELGVGEGYRDPDAIKRRYFILPALDDEHENDPESSDPDPTTAPIGTNTQQPTGTNTLSAIRIDINMKWMNAAQEMLDAVLACSIDTMRKLPNLMYTRLATAVTALLKIHFSVRTGALGEVVTPETVNVAYYLDALAAKLGEAGGGGKYKIPSRWYQVVGVRGRDWYERLERRYSGNIGVGVGLGASPSTGTGVTREPVGISAQTPGIGPGSHHSTATPSSNHSHTHLNVNVNPNTQTQAGMDPYPVSAAVSPIPPHAPGIESGYVAMSGGPGMWPGAGPSPMDAHNPHFFHSLPPGYQPLPAHSHPAMQSQFAYEAQRMPAQGHVQVHQGQSQGQPQAPGMHGTGMELDGWLPDGSIFGMPPLPEF